MYRVILKKIKMCKVIQNNHLYMLKQKNDILVQNDVEKR